MEKTDSRRLSLFRKEFPVVENCLYLDHAGVAPVPSRVKDKVGMLFEELTGWGILRYQDWQEEIERTRMSASALIGASPGEIAFIKNTSQGISIVAEGLNWEPGDNVITFDRDFPSNLYPWMNLRRKGVEVKQVSLRSGRIHVEDIERLIDSRTRVMTVSSVQSVNGFMIDLQALGELCRDREVLLFVDAIQSLGAVPMDVKKCGIDFLAADGHKWMLSPEGTGIFYCREGLSELLNPNLIGWKSVVHDHEFEKISLDLKNDAGRFEEGSLNTLGIYALGASLLLLEEAGLENIHARVLDLGDLVIGQARQRSFRVETPEERESRGGIVSFSGDFNEKKLCEELRNLNIVVNERGGALRVSPHFYNTEEEIMELFLNIDLLV